MESGAERPAQLTQRFTKADRLLRSAQFQRVYRQGRQLHSSLFTLFVLRTHGSLTRMGVTASRKASKLAVLRNRSRRLLREVFRRHKVSVPGGWDVVVNVKFPLTQASYAAVEAEFLRLIKKL
jgi:ribonuclease P protein component